MLHVEALATFQCAAIEANVRGGEKGLARRFCREGKMKTCIHSATQRCHLATQWWTRICRARVCLVGIHLQNRNLKDIHPLMSFLSPTNCVFLSNQTINNKKYVTGEVKFYECSTCMLKSQCTDPQFVTLTLEKEFSVPTE